ncbi:hypothetical protein K1T71_009602 [Dendrolimus kikuchii]|uniref:Uncharacterized protein n=1 Tax=Dendrolimus kikuchii TaxID=765133 RepID=A0ACC1CS35_9NEOP|nr:hypothetical protein K1T71_009602 [Dendrolimus kikuchii]
MSFYRKLGYARDFLDGYTAKAFEFERDIKATPTISEFIGFLEKRALALENTATTSPSVSKSAERLSSHVAVQQPVCIKYSVSIPGLVFSIGHRSCDRCDRPIATSTC